MIRCCGFIIVSIQWWFVPGENFGRIIKRHKGDAGICASRRRAIKWRDGNVLVILPVERQGPSALWIGVLKEGTSPRCLALHMFTDFVALSFRENPDFMRLAGRRLRNRSVHQRQPVEY
jgi:hypothetical protein